MIRPLSPSDREFYLAATEAFYGSDAVIAPIPKEYAERTFNLLTEGSPYAEGYVLEQDGKRAGYALLAKTWSQEAGGLTVWLEEFYVVPEARGRGLGKEFLLFLDAKYKGTARRFRLEVEKENEGAVRLYKAFGFEFFPYDQMKKEL